MILKSRNRKRKNRTFTLKNQWQSLKLLREKTNIYIYISSPGRWSSIGKRRRRRGGRSEISKSGKGLCGNRGAWLPSKPCIMIRHLSILLHSWASRVKAFVVSCNRQGRVEDGFNFANFKTLLFGGGLSVSLQHIRRFFTAIGTRVWGLWEFFTTRGGGSLKFSNLGFYDNFYLRGRLKNFYFRGFFVSFKILVHFMNKACIIKIGVFLFFFF